MYKLEYANPEHSVVSKIAAAHKKGKAFIFGSAEVRNPRKKKGANAELPEPKDLEAEVESAMPERVESGVGVLCHKMLLCPDRHGFNFFRSLCHASGHVFATFVREYNIRYKRMRESPEWKTAHAMSSDEDKERSRKIRMKEREKSRISRRARADSKEAVDAADLVIKQIDNDIKALRKEMGMVDVPERDENGKRLTKKQRQEWKANHKKMDKPQGDAFKAAYRKHGVGIDIVSWIQGGAGAGYDEAHDILGSNSWIRNHLSSKNLYAICKTAYTACTNARKEDGSRVFCRRPGLRPCPTGMMGVASGTIGLSPDGSMFFVKRRGEGDGKTGMSSRKMIVPIRRRHADDAYESRALSYILSGGMRNISVVPVFSGGMLHFELAISYIGKPIPDSIKPSAGVIGVDFGASSTAVFGPSAGGHILEHSPNGLIHSSEIKRLQRSYSRKSVANSPESFDENGAWIRGTKTKRSRRMKLLKRRIKMLEECGARCREQEANLLGKRISRMGDIVKVEDCSMEEWSKAAGKGVKKGTPATVKKSLIKHARRAGSQVFEVNTIKIKATQYDPVSGAYNKLSLKQRRVVVGGVEVDRDLKSAYVLSHVNNDQIDTVAARNEWQASCGQLQGRVDP